MALQTRHAVLFLFVGSLMLSASATGVRANDPCVANGTTLICQGDQVDGVVESSGAYDTLLVNSLTAGIATVDMTGIFFSTNGLAMTLRSATGPFGISTTGDFAPGINVVSQASLINAQHTFSSADILLFSDDTIVTSGEESYGIALDMTTSVIESLATADVSATGGNGNATVTGAITTHGVYSHGIDAFNAVSAVATVAGSQATATGGDVTVQSTHVETHGEDSVGVLLRQNLSANGHLLSSATGGHIAVSSGIVTTRGDYAAGVGAHSLLMMQGRNASGTTSAITIESDTVRTFGVSSTGLNAAALAIAETEDAATILGREISVTNLGLVETHGEASNGIVLGQQFEAISDNATAYARSGSVEVDNEGLVDVRGLGAAGIVVGQEVVAVTRDASSSAIAIVADTVVNSKDVRVADGFAGIAVLNMAVADAAGEGQAYGSNITINAHDIRVTGDENSMPLVVGIMVVNGAENRGASGLARAGDVFVKTTGTISVEGGDPTGLASIGIMAGSGADGAGAEHGDVSIHVASGSVSAQVAVAFMSEGDNGLANFGTVAGQLAVVGGDGHETIENWGTIAGSIDLGNGDNEFNNYAPGVFVSRDFVNLGLGTLTNAGLLTPGGAGALQVTAFGGNLVQTESGRFAVDLDYATRDSDRLEIDGTASLAGTVVGRALATGAAGLEQRFHILNATGGVTDDGLTAQDTAAVDYSVYFDPNGEDVHLGAVIDFSGRGGLNPNQARIGRAMNTIQANGAPAWMASGLVGLMNVPTTADLGRAYDQLSPVSFGQQQAEGQGASADFANTLMSCREAGGPNAAIREGECLWARARATDINVDGSATNVGSNSRVGSFSAGLQVAMAADWRIGVALGYDLISRSTQSGASTDGERTNIGAVVKYNPGPFLFAAGGAAGWGSFETDRRMAFGGFAATATSKSDTDYVSGWLHAAYLADQGRWYLKPLVEARVTELDFSGARETGGGGFGLVIAGSRDTMLSVSPAIEVGTEFRFDALAVWRPFVRAGVTWQDEDSFVTHAAFAAAPGAPGFQIVTDVDDVLFDISAGVDVIGVDGAVLRAQYDGRFGSTLSQNSVSLKGSVPF